MDREELARRIRSGNWVILTTLGLASFFLMDDAFTLGVLLGGLVIIANFNLLARTVRGAFTPNGMAAIHKPAIVGKYYLRLLALGLVIYILIHYGRIHPVGLVIGLSTVVISIVSLGIRDAWKLSTGEAR
jgi:hypothetical protein